MSRNRLQLKQLEVETIHIMREMVAGFANPVMLKIAWLCFIYSKKHFV